MPEFVGTLDLDKSGKPGDVETVFFCLDRF